MRSFGRASSGPAPRSFPVRPVLPAAPARSYVPIEAVIHFVQDIWPHRPVEPSPGLAFHHIVERRPPRQRGCRLRDAQPPRASRKGRASIFGSIRSRDLPQQDADFGALSSHVFSLRKEHSIETRLAYNLLGSASRRPWRSRAVPAVPATP